MVNDEPKYSEVVISSEGRSIRLPKCSAAAAQKLADACQEAFPATLIEIACDGIRTMVMRKSKETQILVTPSKRFFVQDRLDLYTDDGDYLFSICKGRDHKWRKIMMYRDHSGKEAIGNVSMTDPDYINESGMNFRECPFCKGRSSTCEDCCGSGWVWQ